LFPRVPVGTPGEFTYQPVKAGVRGGVVYVEAHQDIYGYAPALFREATAALERAHLADHADQQLLVSALEDAGGVPVRVSPAPAEGAAIVPAAAVERGVEAHRDGVPHPNDRQAGDD
jgi:hypothetical protein